MLRSGLMEEENTFHYSQFFIAVFYKMMVNSIVYFTVP